MRSFLFASLFTLALADHVTSQNIQAGFGVAINNTFFHKGNSEYIDENTGGAIAPGFGVFGKLFFRLNESWAIRTGAGVHLKKYRCVTENLDFPGVDGQFNFEANFTSIEIPLVISYKTSKQKTYKFEYSAGVVSSFHIPYSMEIGYEMDGTVPPVIGMYSTYQAWESTYSPDLYISVSLLKMDNMERRQEFSISYQYGLAPTSEFHYMAFLANDVVTRVFPTKLAPTLSSFMLKYTYYPRWLSFAPLGASVKDL
jgi:hypothetical protein